MAGWSRPELTAIAKELGLWGGAVGFATSTSDIERALAAQHPAEPTKLSTLAARFYGVRAQQHAEQACGEASTPTPPPSAPVAPIGPSRLQETLPGGQAIPMPPAPGAALRFARYNLEQIGLVAADCPGTVAHNNAVCLICPEGNDCLEQALAGTVRYPERWHPTQVEPDATPAVSAPPLGGFRAPHSPEYVQAPQVTAVPAPAGARVAQRPAPKPRRRKAAASTPVPEAPPVTLSQLGLSAKAGAVAEYLAQCGLSYAQRRTEVVWSRAGMELVRLGKLKTNKPKVVLVGYRPFGDQADGLRPEEGCYVWDGQDMGQLDHHVRAHLGL